MIFITVGTHEQPFDRLIREVDKIIENGLDTEIFAQIGYSEYIPKRYKFKKFISFEEMKKFVEQADIIVTHGGPGSIFMPLYMRKVPIVVPRRKEFGEHIDNHQLYFAKSLNKQKKIIIIEDISNLSEVLQNYHNYKEECLIEKNTNNINNYVKHLECFMKSYISNLKIRMMQNV
ncbi:hypothetical protein N752_30095 [Desulforamulus aquiferis]|nr:PssE/Cps14G family polysaccharide biosynthesis glycosyltransferase [Desulforamulus aquiferis]RYD01250.1 hypothetical protein N752_30095 [Desulforamulus aquiferis]